MSLCTETTDYESWNFQKAEGVPQFFPNHEVRTLCDITLFPSCACPAVPCPTLGQRVPPNVPIHSIFLSTTPLNQKNSWDYSAQWDKGGGGTYYPISNTKVCKEIPLPRPPPYKKTQLEGGTPCHKSNLALRYRNDQLSILSLWKGTFTAANTHPDLRHSYLRHYLRYCVAMRKGTFPFLSRFIFSWPLKASHSLWG